MDLIAPNLDDLMVCGCTRLITSGGHSYYTTISVNYLYKNAALLSYFVVLLKIADFALFRYFKSSRILAISITQLWAYIKMDHVTICTLYSTSTVVPHI